MRWLRCLAAVVAVWGAECGAADFRIRLDEQYRYVEAGPLADEQWRGIETDLASHAAGVLTVHVGKPASFNARPMLGTYTRVANQLRFEPRFAFQPGVSYVARCSRPSTSTADERPRVESLGFSRPVVVTDQQHCVAAVYPSAARLPENLLKFYIHFSGPMSRGEVYRRVRLVGEDGDLDLPFLELGEELWDPEGRRLTLLFDPGRIKRGLKPREDAGQILESGKHYVLKIDAGWPDARGVPLSADYEKEFLVTPADYTQPDAAQWQLEVPRSRTSQSLVVTFTEPMDHALCLRVLSVLGPDDAVVDGMATVSREETRWAFQPTHPWLPGAYRLVFDTALEDVAGNSIGRPFEVKDPASQRPVVDVRRFTVTEVPAQTKE